MPHDLRLIATPSTRHLPFPELTNIASEWFDDPVDPNVVLYKDEDTGYFVAIDLKSMTQRDQPCSLWEQMDFYGGRQLVCPDDCRLGVSELCAEPGSYYGPWRVIDRTQTGQDFVIGQSHGDAFESAVEAVKPLIGAKLPEPIPRPKGENEPAVLPLPYAHVGLVYSHLKTLDDIWEELYVVMVFDHTGRKVNALHLGEDQGPMILLRDDPEYFAKAMGDSLKVPPEGVSRYQWQSLPTLPAETDHDFPF